MEILEVGRMEVEWGGEGGGEVGRMKERWGGWR